MAHDFDLEDLENGWARRPDDKRCLVIASPNGIALDVLPQDPITRSGDLLLLNELNSVTLAVIPVVGEYTITLEAGHGVVSGNYIVLIYDQVYYQARVVSVATNVITMALPNFYAFPLDSEGSRKSARLETVDGSTTPVYFKIAPPDDQKWDVYGVSIALRDATDMDDALFAGAPALTRGLLFGRTTAGVLETRFNITSNSDMKLIGEFAYSSKAPSGEYGCDFYKDLRNNNGVAMRLDGALDQAATLVVQDLLTVLTFGRVMLHGHIVED